MAGGERPPALPSSRDQLDRLLQGLDELSGTLPDLSGGADSWSSGGGRGQCGGQVPGHRSYEEDVDYVLERDERRRGGEGEQERRGGEVQERQEAPYHTRVDSKPFSYIRSVK